MRIAIALAAAITLMPSLAAAQDRLTVNQCMMVARGLRALDYVGATPDGPPLPPAGAKQYKLGALRGVIGLNLAALQRVGDGIERARQGLVREIFEGKGVSPGPDMDRMVEQMQKILDGPCEVTPARIKLSELNLGDLDTQNAIPPTTVAALALIIDRDQ